MKIGLTYNLKDDAPAGPLADSEFTEEFDTRETIQAICGVFQKNNYTVAQLGGGIDIVEKIKKEKIDFVFNIAEGHNGRNRESHIPAVLEMLGIPYSGSDPLTLGLTLDKSMSKKIAFCAGIPTPCYGLAKSSEELKFIEHKLNYPLIIKPAWEGSSKGIYNSSKVFDKEELEKNAKVLFKKYPSQPLLVEEYIKGREITVGVVGNESPQILGLLEIANKINPGEDVFYSLETKRNWKKMIDYISPPDMDSSCEKHLRSYALLAFKEFGCRDVARIDFRISKQNKIYLLEVNPLPGLSPEYADLVIMAGKNNINYSELIMSILKHGLLRYR